jgi:hypothetical protein
MEDSREFKVPVVDPTVENSYSCSGETRCQHLAAVHSLFRTRGDKLLVFVSPPPIHLSAFSWIKPHGLVLLKSSSEIINRCRHLVGLSAGVISP